MSIHKYNLNNGDLRYEVLTYVPTSKGTRQIHKRGFLTLDKAKDYEAKVRLEVTKVTSNVQFKSVIHEFLDYKETQGLKDRSLYDYESMLFGKIYPFFGDVKIKSITIKRVREWQKSLLIQKLSKARCKSLQQLFKQLMRFATREGYIKSNPFDSLDYVYPKTVNKPMDYYTLDDYKRFRQAITSDLDRLIFDMLYFTGMRKGELLARKWSDLDMTNKTLLINTTWDYRTLRESMSTKTGEARTIYLNDLLINELRQWHEQHPHTRYILQHKTLDRPIDKNILPNHYKAIMSNISDLKCIRIHDFRHSHVSFLINNGLDSFRIAERLGHSKDMVERRYGHLFPDRKAEILNIINVDL